MGAYLADVDVIALHNRYRRGKEKSSDVDIVISHPDYIKGGEIIRGLCKKLVGKMHKSGMSWWTRRLFASFNN
jgi:hypothetical protein